MTEKKFKMCQLTEVKRKPEENVVRIRRRVVLGWEFPEQERAE